MYLLRAASIIRSKFFHASYDAPTDVAVSTLLTVNNRITWTETDATATGVLIRRSVDGGAFSDLITVAAGLGTYDDPAIEAGRTYTYLVAVTGPGGRSRWGIASTTVPPAPAAPSNLTLTTMLTTVTTARVNITWTDNASDETGFLIHRADDPGFTANLAIYTRRANATSYVQTGLPIATTYYYRMCARTAFGQSDWVYASITTAS
ncbi:MAG: fibronectin type III domain-containing protein [bacterium]|nr:fibronectin type III domain-containing protein [bacterium]